MWVRTLTVAPAAMFIAWNQPEYATHEVTVQEDPSRALTVQLAYGDGTSDSRVVPAGSGEATVSFSHRWPRSQQSLTFYQRATVVETGRTSLESVTVVEGTGDGGCTVGWGLPNYSAPMSATMHSANSTPSWSRSASATFVNCRHPHGKGPGLEHFPDWQHI